MDADRGELLALLTKCSTNAHVSLAERNLVDADAWLAAADELVRQLDALPAGDRGTGSGVTSP